MKLRDAVIATVLVAGALAAVPDAARAEDEKAAAEHFALAEAAEKREDWPAAIDEYERAYAASPHPAVLYNIGANYERLGEHRTAAEYFRRYLDESGTPDDRERVERRIERLRQKKSRVSIEVSLPEAVVFVDGTERGNGSMALELEAGEHTIYAAHAGRTSEPREIAVAYGDPVTVTIDMDAHPGVLIVSANVNGAEIRLDGDRIGHTPYSGTVPSGEHQVAIAKAGYDEVRRDVDIPPRGSQQVRVELSRLDGADGAGPEDGGARFVLDMGYGLDSAHGGLRYLIGLDYRHGSRLWDVGVALGKLNDASGGAFGVDGRVYFLTGRVRPYLRAGVIAYRPSAADSAHSRVEAGSGVLFGGQESSNGTYAVEYFLELDGHLRLQGESATTTEDDPAAGAVVVAGIGFRFGG